MFEKDGKAEKKLVVWFTNDERGLVLNKTNNRTIRGAFGDDTADWIGKIIVVFPTMTDFRGKMTPALRVRIPPPKQASSGSSATAGDVRQWCSSSTAVLRRQLRQQRRLPWLLPQRRRLLVDPELEPDPVKPIGEELDDEIAF